MWWVERCVEVVVVLVVVVSALAEAAKPAARMQRARRVFIG